MASTTDFLFDPAFDHVNQDVNDFDTSIFEGLDWPFSQFINFDDDEVVLYQTQAEHPQHAPAELDIPSTDAAMWVVNDDLQSSSQGQRTSERKRKMDPTPDPILAQSRQDSSMGIVETAPNMLLKQWTSNNPAIIHPDSTTKMFLPELTGLSLKQVSTWFNNHRQRTVKAGATLTSTSQSSKQVDAPGTDRSLVSNSISGSIFDSQETEHIQPPPESHEGPTPSILNPHPLKPQVYRLNDFLDDTAGDFVEAWLRLQELNPTLENANLESSIGMESSNEHQNTQECLPEDEILCNLPAPTSDTIWRFGSECKTEDNVRRHLNARPPSSGQRYTSCKSRKLSSRHSTGSSADDNSSSAADSTSLANSSSAVDSTSSANLSSTLGPRRGRRIQNRNAPPPAFMNRGVFYNDRLKCDVCSKPFRRRSALNRHMNTAHTASRYWVLSDTCIPKLL